MDLLVALTPYGFISVVSVYDILHDPFPFYLWVEKGVYRNASA